MKTVLVTGSNGLLGQKLTDQILKNPNLKLIATSKGANKHISAGEYIYQDLDIRNQDQVSKVFLKYRPDAVIHTAAITNADICHVQQALCRITNVDAVGFLTEAANKVGSHFIYLSTDFVFDGKDGPYDEVALPNPISVYGQSKLDGEEVVSETCKSWAIIRTVLVYGVLKNLSRSNIVLWAKNALEKGEPINVVDDQWRTPTLAEDLADACILAAEKSATGIYHVSGKDMMSVLEIVNAVADYWKLDRSIVRPISSASLNQDAKRPAKTGFRIEKAIGELGYKPHSFTEGLAIVDKQLKQL